MLMLHVVLVKLNAFLSQVSTDYCDPEELNMPTADTNGGHGHGSGVPRASLICRPNSHPFQDRMLGLDQPVKVGVNQSELSV